MGACQGALVVYTVGQKHIAKEHCNAFLVQPKGFAKPRPRSPTGAFLLRGTQSAGHGLFESSLLLPHKIRAKQKE